MAEGNGGPLVGLQGYLQEISKQDDELDTLRGSYMAECKGPRGAIKEIMDSAREAGVNMKAFRELLTKHRADRRHEKRVAGMEADDAAALDEMIASLGDFVDTPLGGAAVARHPGSSLNF
jgi:F0F1-type ATP synthase membrane subunit b/b'